jgi:hypothetical protein
MTWGSNKTDVNDIQAEIQASSQKWMNKNYDVTYKQTEQYLAGLPSGTYTFQFPFVIPQIVKAHPELTISGYNSQTDTVTVVKG